MSKLLQSAVLAAALAFPTVAFAEKQPHMRAAHEALKKAREALEKASPDKGGHRVKAIELVEAALAEVKAGMEFDDKH